MDHARIYIILFILQLKMPPSVGNKKTKAVEQLLEELGVGKFTFKKNYFYSGS